MYTSLLLYIRFVLLIYKCKAYLTLYTKFKWETTIVVIHYVQYVDRNIMLLNCFTDLEYLLQIARLDMSH